MMTRLIAKSNYLQNVSSQRGITRPKDLHIYVRSTTVFVRKQTTFVIIQDQTWSVSGPPQLFEPFPAFPILTPYSGLGMYHSVLHLRIFAHSVSSIFCPPPLSGTCLFIFQPQLKCLLCESFPDSTNLIQSFPFSCHCCLIFLSIMDHITLYCIICLIYKIIWATQTQR